MNFWPFHSSEKPLLSKEKILNPGSSKINFSANDEKVPCKKCGAIILPAAANANGGLCSPCSSGKNKKEERRDGLYQNSKKPYSIELTYCEENTPAIIVTVQDTDFKAIKDWSKLIFPLSAHFSESAAIISLKIEFITGAFVQELIGIIDATRNKQTSLSIVIRPIEPIVVEVLIDPSLEHIRKKLFSYENEKSWRVIIAPASWADSKSVDISDLGESLRQVRLKVDEHISSISSENLNFLKALETIRKKPVPIWNSVLFNDKLKIDNDGKSFLVFQSAAELESYFADSLSKFGIILSNWY